MEGDGGINERGEKGGPSVKRRGIKVISLSFAEGEGGSPVRTAGDRGLVFFMGGREERKVNKK